MSNTLELRGRTVIVTSASSGIGGATARALHAGSTSACVPAAPPPAARACDVVRRIHT